MPIILGDVKSIEKREVFHFMGNLVLWVKEKY